MASEIPSTMRAIALAKYSKPNEYDFGTLPTPTISNPDDVLIKVHAASINPIDVKMAGGMAKSMATDSFPYKIGYDCAGVIAAVGTAVTSLKVGDEVYSRIPSKFRGSVAEFVLSTDSATALKPKSLTFTEAASIPLVGLTALQALQLADQTLQGGVKGKTVLVPGGLSGTGSLAIQLAKNVFGAEKVITTLSTGKIEKAKELLGAETFTAVDYTKENVVASVGSDTVDYLFDTMGTTVSYLATVKKGGLIISISTIPSGSLIKKSMSADIPYYIECIMNFVDWGLRWWTGRKGVNYSYIFMTPSAKDLDSLSTWIEEGKITPIVGRTAKFDDLEGVRTGCQQIFDGKGGIGKFVIEMA